MAIKINHYRPLLCALFMIVFSLNALAEKIIAIKNISANSIYFTVFSENTGGWFSSSAVEKGQDADVIEIKPQETRKIIVDTNSIAFDDGNPGKFSWSASGQSGLLVFARFAKSLKSGDYANNKAKAFITSYPVTSLTTSGELFAETLVTPNYQWADTPTETTKGTASHRIVLFTEIESQHNQPIKVANESDNTIFIAAYNCRLDIGNITQNKSCTRVTDVTAIAGKNAETLSQIRYDTRARVFSNLDGNTYFAYLIMSQLEDDLPKTRDLRESAMRQIVRSTRYVYNPVYDLVANSSTKNLWLYTSLNGIYVTDSSFDFSKISKILKDAAIGAINWFDWSIYEKWISPVKKIINEISQDPNRFKETHLRRNDSLSVGEQEFLGARKKQTALALTDILKEKTKENFANVPVIATCMSGGGFRAMLSSFGFAMGLQEIGVLNAVTYQVGLSGSSWYLSKYMAAAKKRAVPVNFEKLKSDLIKRAQKIRIPQVNEHGQIAYLLAPIFKKFIYYQPITPVDLYAALLGAQLLDLGSETFVNRSFSGFREITGSGLIPMPIGTAISKTNDHWFEITPYEVGSSELKGFIETIGFGRTYLNGKSIDNAPEITLHNAMGFMGSAFALRGFDFLKHLAPSLISLPPDLSGMLNQILRLTQGLNLQREVPSEKKGLSFQDLQNISDALEHWKTLYDSMPYGFVFIAKPEVDNEQGWESQGVIPAGIIPNPFYKLEGEPRIDKKLIAERYLELRDAGIFFNLPFPPLLRPERNINIIIAYDASSDISTAGASAIISARKYVREYAKKYGKTLKFPEMSDEEIKQAGQQSMSIIGDPDNADMLTIIYLNLLPNSQLKKYKNYDASKDPKTNTFNFEYPPESSKNLIESAHENVLFYKDKILDVILRKSRALNKK